MDQWLLLEYACCFLPCQQNAVVEAVSKSVPIPDEFRKVLGIDPATVRQPIDLPAIAFTPLEEIELALMRTLAAVDVAELARKVVQTRLDQWRGRV